MNKKFLMVGLLASFGISGCGGGSGGGAPQSISVESSSSPAVSSLSSSSSSKSSAALQQYNQVNGQVKLYWKTPRSRVNGEALQFTDLGGYELRYKQKDDAAFTSFYIQSSETDNYTFDFLQGEYTFEIAVFDTDDLYSQFVTIYPYH